MNEQVEKISNEQLDRISGSAERELRTVLQLIVDNVDYTSGICRLSDAVASCLPMEILLRAKAALKLYSSSADDGREKIEQKRRKKFDEMLAKMGEKEAAEFLDTLSKGLTDEGRESIEFADWLLRGDPQRVYQYDKPYWSIRNSPLLNSKDAYELFAKMRASNVKYMP